VTILPYAEKSGEEGIKEKVCVAPLAAAKWRNGGMAKDDMAWQCGVSKSIIILHQTINA